MIAVPAGFDILWYPLVLVLRILSSLFEFCLLTIDHIQYHLDTAHENRAFPFVSKLSQIRTVERYTYSTQTKRQCLVHFVEECLCSGFVSCLC